MYIASRDEIGFGLGFSFSVASSGVRSFLKRKKNNVVSDLKKKKNLYLCIKEYIYKSEYILPNIYWSSEKIK